MNTSKKTTGLHIFVVEDDPSFGKALTYSLSSDPDFEIKRFATGNQCLEHLHLKPDIVTLDYRLPDSNGMEILRKIKSYNPDIAVIIISGQEEISVALNLLKEGAFDYITKDKDCTAKVQYAIQHFLKNKKLSEEIHVLRKEIPVKYDINKIIIGQCEAIREVFQRIEKAAKVNILVMLTGETGTGKELVAKAIHYGSQNAEGPFYAINMPAIPKDLIESELFGHEKGSFTGAHVSRTGKFESAQNGTLFLDEIGDMDFNLQSKLLRVLQEKEFSKIGSNDILKTHARIIAATNKVLAAEVKKGNFREDLYYRLQGFTIHLPPLRERGSDVLMIARHLLDIFSNENKLPRFSIHKDASNKIVNHSWPGNIRELKSVLERAALLTDGNELLENHIEINPQASLDVLEEKELTMEEYKMKILNFFMKKYNQEVETVAKKLNLGTATVYRMMKGEKGDATS